MDRPLIVTSDSTLRDAALRACAAAGVSAEVAPPVEARSRWRSAPAILVGGDVADRCVELGVPRRPGVLLLSAGDRPWQLGVAVGAEGVFVAPDDDERLIEAVASAVDGGREGCVISVVGGCGGSWASTFAAGLGLTAARRGLRSVLIDADPLGGGIDLLLGIEHVDGLRWPQVDGSSGRLAAGSLADVLPARDGLAALSWTRDPAPVAQVGPILTAAAGDFDVVVADVPRRLDANAVEVLARSVLTVLTVPCDLRAVAASRLAAEALRGTAGPVVAVACARPGGLDVSAVSDMVGVPVVATLRHDRGLGAAVNGGHGPGRSRTLRRAANAVLDLVGLEP